MDKQAPTNWPTDYKGFLDAPVRALSWDESLIFMALAGRELTADSGNISTRHDLHLAGDLLDNPFLQILNSRIPHGVDVDKRVAIFCSACSLLSGFGTPGVAVTWAFTLSRMYWESRGRVSFKCFIKYFPTGIPDLDKCHHIWENQKGWKHGLPFDNLLDRSEFWEAARISIESADNAQQGHSPTTDALGIA